MSELARALARAWLAYEGRPPVEERIHPDDDMLRYILALGAEPERGPMLYLRSGWEPLRMLRHLHAQLGTPLSARRRVLEFACGYGRCTRFLVQEVGAGRLVCADVLPAAVRFVHATFGVPTFVSAHDPGALDLGGPYDLIWVGSLFSHLPLARFRTFLARLYGALAADGVLVFSTHGVGQAPQALALDDGFGFVPESETRALPGSEYGTTWVSPARVHRLAAELGVGAVCSAELELWDSQDVHVASHAPLPALAGWSTPYVRGSIARADVDPHGHAWIGGWARASLDAGPLAGVELRIGSALAVGTLLGPAQVLALPAAPERRWHHVEWYVEGPTAALAPGVHPVSALGRTAGGARSCFDVRALAKP